MSPRKKIATDDQAVETARDEVPAASGGSRQAKPGLSREAIVFAALAILDREGYEALSMRKLGKELGVDPMAIYYHIPNKSALLDALVEGVMAGIDLGLDDAGRTIEERLITAAHAYREALLAHPGLIPAVANRPPRTIAALRPVEILLGIFLDGGFSPEDALSAVNIFATFVRGTVMREAPYWFDLPGSDAIEDSYNFSQVMDLMEMLPPEEFPNIKKTIGKPGFLGFEAEFDRGARALIRGLLEIYGSKKGAGNE